MYQTRLQLFIWLLLALVSGLAILKLSERYFIKIDFSEGERYTLSAQVQDSISDLRDPLIIKAFLPLSAPEPYRQIARHTRDLLIELKSVHPLLSLELIDSAAERSLAEKEQLVKQALEFGVKKSQISTENQGQRILMEIPFGISWARLNQRVVTAPVERIAEIEYQMILALQQLMSLRPAQKIAIAQGAGEPDLINSPLAKRLESEGELIPLNLNQSEPRSDLDVLVILGATQSYGERARWMIDRVLCDGGGVILALDYREQSQLFPKIWSTRHTGLESLLARYGIKVHPQWFIADSEHPMPAPLSRDAHDQVIFAPHPLYPQAVSSKHPITAPFTELTMPMSPWFELPDTAEVLLSSQASALALRALPGLDISQAREQKSSSLGFPLAFALNMQLESCLKPPASEFASDVSSDLKTLVKSKEGVHDSPLASALQSRLVVLGSGRRLLSSNRLGLELLLNSIAWARGDTALLTLKQSRKAKAKIKLSLDQQRMIQWSTVLLPSFILLLLTWYIRRQRT